MRVAKMGMNGEHALLGAACKKFKVSVLAYPLSVASTKRDLDVYFTLIMSGNPTAKGEFFKHIKKQERIGGLERKGDFILGQIKEKKTTQPLYRHNLLHIEPIQIDEKGHETWTVGSFNDKAIEDFVKQMETYFNSKLLKLNSQKEPNVSILTVYPKLTSLQKQALQSAIQMGYYEYPRKSELKEIAETMRLSYSTYHAHLRKAEKKIIPFLFDKNK